MKDVETRLYREVSINQQIVYTLFNTLNMGHLSVREDNCLLIHPEGIDRLDLHTGQRTPLVTGIQADDAGLQAALDPTGHCAVYLADTGGRLDAFLLDLTPPTELRGV